ncbi:MAG TPA: cupredoxin domain-containing protein [Gaiellaceae bacterium]
MKRLAPIGLLVVALAGCGGSSKSSGTTQQAASPSSSGKTVQIKETEFKLAPAKITIASTGTVTFEATNSGQIDHALELEGNGVEERMDTISPGSTGKLTVDLSKAGTYDLYCPIDGHRGMGMQATVVVGGDGGGGGGGTTTNGTTSTSGGGYGY